MPGVLASVFRVARRSTKAIHGFSTVLSVHLGGGKICHQWIAIHAVDFGQNHHSHCNHDESTTRPGFGWSRCIVLSIVWRVLQRLPPTKQSFCHWQFTTWIFVSIMIIPSWQSSCHVAAQTCRRAIGRCEAIITRSYHHGSSTALPLLLDCRISSPRSMLHASHYTTTKSFRQPWSSSRRRFRSTSPLATSATTTSSSSNNSSSSSLDDVWRKTTERLLTDYPMGSLPSSAWSQAHATILYWQSQDHADSIRFSLQLLNRLVDEELSDTTKTTHPDFYTTDLLNLVLNHWRKLVSAESKWRQNEGMDPQSLVQHLEKFHNVQSKLQPNTQSFAMILDGAASFALDENDDDNSAVQVADRLVQWIIQEAPTHEWMQPNIYTFSSLMNVWVKSQRKEAPERVEALLDQMHDLSLEYPDWDVAPNQFTYATAIDAWAKEGRVDRVEQLLQDMHSAYQQAGLDHLKPNLKAFNGLLVALAKAGEMDRAQQVLQQLQDLYESGELEEPPSVISYSTVLDAFAKSKQRGSAQRAEAILRQMKDRGVEPNYISWNTVIDAYAKERNPDRAESLLREMNDAYLQGNQNVKPTMRTYVMVLSAWSMTPSRHSGERGEQLLEIMKKFAEAGELENLDLIAYNTVLACWARSTANDAASRAKAFLETKMIQGGIKPDSYSLNTVMSALVRDGKLAEADSMLDSMQEHGVVPDVTTYNTLLNAWIKSGSKQAAKRVEALYERMKADPNVEADLITMNTLLHFYSKKGDTQMAEALLDEMCSPESKVHPDAISFNTLVAAWTRSTAPDAPERGEAILKRMLKLDSRRVRPNAIMFNSLMNAWVKTRPSEALPECKRLVGMMFDLVAEGNNSAKPDGVTYGTLIHAHSLSDDPEAQYQAEIIFEDMYRRFQEGDHHLRPTVHVYGSMIHGWSRRSLPDAGTKAEEVLRLWIKRADAGEVDGRPKVFAFTAVMNAHANNSRDPYAAYKVDGLLGLLLKEHENGSHDAKPTSRLFTAVLRALVSSPIAEKEQPARRIIQLMKQHNIRPDRFKLDLLKKCIDNY